MATSSKKLQKLLVSSSGTKWLVKTGIATSRKKLQKLLVAPGISSSSKKLLVAKGTATGNKKLFTQQKWSNSIDLTSLTKTNGLCGSYTILRSSEL